MKPVKQNILIAVDDFTPEQLGSISTSVTEWAFVKAIPQASEETVYREELERTDICIGWPQAAWLKDSTVRYLQIGSSGWDAYQQKGLEAIAGFNFCTAKGIYTTGLVEHALAMMFALVRRIPAFVHDKEQRQFRRHLPYAAEITGARACVVGMGDAGVLLARKLKALGMYVIAVVRRIDVAYEDADSVYRATDMRAAIAGADHIFLLVPGTPENENIFDRTVFDACKTSAFFYNLSRGSNVDEDALYQCLIEKRIAGAGLDVTRVEPLPENNKLWTLGDNVLITGHSAGLSTGHPRRFCELVIRNLYNYHCELPMENRVI